MRAFQLFAVAALGLVGVGAAHAATPMQDLESYSPSLVTLTTEYPKQFEEFETYAQSQDFTDAHEMLAVAVHELIHVASAAHNGYWVHATVYDGYARSFWAGLSAENVQPTPAERDQMAAILSNYWERNPRNDLGNILDEINAYGETAPFVCRYAPAHQLRQISPLVGHLTLLNAWLRAFRESSPARYQSLKSSSTTRGIVSLLVGNAWQTLARCGLHQLTHQEEVQRFLDENFYQ